MSFTGATNKFRACLSSQGLERNLVNRLLADYHSFLHVRGR